MPGTEKQNSMFKETRGYTQGGNPFPVLVVVEEEMMGPH